MEDSSINIWIAQCLNFHACVSFNLMFSPPPNTQSSQTPNFQKTAMVCEWAENNANDCNEVLRFTSACLLCGLPCRGTEQIEGVLAQKVYDHRGISEEDLSSWFIPPWTPRRIYIWGWYSRRRFARCKWVPCMPNERPTSWGKRGGALLPALSGKATADLRKRIRLPDSTLQRRRSPKRRFDSSLFELLTRPVEQREFAKSESVFDVYLSPVAMKTKQWSLSLWSGTHPVHLG